MSRLLGYTFCAVLSLMLLAAPIVVAGGGCINRNAANDGAFATVQIKDCSFAPTITRVPVDSAVTWKNVDYLPHVISGVGWGSAEGYANYGQPGTLNPGGTFTFTFAKSGLYPYTCYLHPGMSGLVIVGDVDTTTVPVITAANAATPSAAVAPATTRVAAANDSGSWIAPAALGAVAAVALTGFGLSRLRREKERAGAQRPRARLKPARDATAPAARTPGRATR